MAKMHSRAKGKSKSKRPYRKSKLTWVRYGKKELEIIITKLAKAGKTASEIGIILRDTYGVPSLREIIGKRLVEFLKEKNLYTKLPEDLIALIRKDIKLIKHLEAHKKDMAVRRGLILTESKIHRLSKYYKTTHLLPQDWSYDRANARLYLE